MFVSAQSGIKNDTSMTEQYSGQDCELSTNQFFLFLTLLCGRLQNCGINSMEKKKTEQGYRITSKEAT